MTNHTVWGHASDALYTLHSKNAAEMEYAPDEPLRSQFVLGLFNAAGDGIALGGTRRELLTYLRTAIEHIERETDPRGELDQALRRLHTLRQQRGTALEAGDQAAVTRLDEEEVSVLDDVAYAAEICQRRAVTSRTTGPGRPHPTPGLAGPPFLFRKPRAPGGAEGHLAAAKGP